MDDREYFDRSAMFDTLTRDQALIDYNYRELCFNMDTFYGQPSKSVLSKSIAEKGFDRTLEEYNDDTRKAKQWLLSDQWIDYYAGMFMLQRYLDDGGHTAMIMEPGFVAEKYPETAFAAQWKRINRDEYEAQTDQEKVIKDLTNEEMLKRFNDAFMIGEVRNELYQAYTDSKRWENGDLCIVDGDTAVFAFDSFNNESTALFKWSLDHAEELGAKTF